MPNAQRYFYLTESSTQATVYNDAGLSAPLTQPIIADAHGLFQTIYLNPAVQYRAVLLNAAGQKIEDVDPVNNNQALVAIAASKSATTSKSNTSGASPDTDLQILLPSAGTYRVEADVAFSTGLNTIGLSIAFGFSGQMNIAGENTFAIAGLLNNAQVLPATPISAGSGVSTSFNNVSTTTIQNVMRFMGTIQVLSAGTLSFNWGPFTSNAAATSLLAGSTMVATMIGSPTTKIGIPFVDPNTKPLVSANGLIANSLPNAQRTFWIPGSGFTLQQQVYSNASLLTPIVQPVVADANGRFPPVYFNPVLQYAEQLKNSGGVLQRQNDPVSVSNTFEPSVWITKNAPTTITNNAVLAGDPDLTFNIGVVGTYKFELDLEWQSASAQNLQLQLAYTAAMDANSAQGCVGYGSITSGTVQFPGNTLAYNTVLNGLSITGNGAAVGNVFRLCGIIKVTAAGTFQLQWAQQTSSATPLTLQAGSTLAITRVQ